MFVEFARIWTYLHVFPHICKFLHVSVRFRKYLHVPARVNAYLRSMDDRTAFDRDFSSAVDAGFRVTLAPLEKSQLEEQARATLAPLFVSDFGSLWTDWPLTKRHAEGRPSVTIAHLGGGRLQLSRLDGDAGRGCTFYRGHCVRKWLPCMTHRAS